jgi:flagellar hook assembly protein FlgD
LQRVLTSVTLLGLLVLTAAAFAITEHLKLIKSPIFGTHVTVGTQVAKPPQLSPVCHGENHCQGTAWFGFRLRHSDRVTVTIRDGAHHTVATIAPGEKLGAHAPQKFPWHGRTDDGTPVPNGAYYPWVHLAHARRTFRFTNKIVVDSTPPTVRLKASTPVLLAGPNRTVRIHYVFSEPAHALVYLGGRLIIRGRKTQQQFKFDWAGKAHGDQLPAGRYVLSVGAQDIAGNETPAAKRKDVTVVIRYVKLSPEQLAVRSGSRVRVNVETAAPRYTWRLGRRHGSHRGRILHVRAPTTPGTYRLVVTANGGSAITVVRVHG